MEKATQTDTGISRTVNSEADGAYIISNLPLGPYQLEVNKDGFSTAVQSGIVLQVNSDPAIPVALKVGRRDGSRQRGSKRIAGGNQQRRRGHGHR